MRIISYRFYTISHQWYEFFACFFLMWHGGTSGAAVACAVVKAFASGAHQRCHLSRSGQAVINCWKGIIVEAEEGQRVINPVHCARKVTLLVAVRAVDAHLLHFGSLLS